MSADYFGAGTPDTAGLRRFGLVLAAAVALIFGIAIPLLRGRAWSVWPWAVAAVPALWAAIAPSTLAGFHRAWMRLALALGWVNSRIILTLTFFGLFTPVALLFRLIGRDPLARRVDRAAATYRRPSVAAPRRQMERPY